MKNRNQQPDGIENIEIPRGIVAKVIFRVKVGKAHTVDPIGPGRKAGRIVAKAGKEHGTKYPG